MLSYNVLFFRNGSPVHCMAQCEYLVPCSEVPHQSSEDVLATSSPIRIPSENPPLLSWVPPTDWASTAHLKKNQKSFFRFDFSVFCLLIVGKLWCETSISRACGKILKLRHLAVGLWGLGGLWGWTKCDTCLFASFPLLISYLLAFSQTVTTNVEQVFQQC